MDEKNINLSYLKNIVSEEGRIVINSSHYYTDKYRELHEIREKYYSNLNELGITDIKENYFSKRLIWTTLKNFKKRIKRKQKKQNKNV